MPLKLRPWLSQVRAMPDALDRTGAVMAVINLIKKNVDAAPIGEKDSYRWDTELKGFGLKVTPAARRIYIYQYRTGGRGSPTKRVALGVHGEITCDKARDDPKRHAGAVTDGVDPAALKAAEGQAPTVSVIADRFMKEHVSKRAPRTQVESKRLLDKIILPALGSKQVKDARRSDVSRLHHAMRDKRYEANRVLALLSKMFNLAEAWTSGRATPILAVISSGMPRRSVRPCCRPMTSPDWRRPSMPRQTRILMLSRR